MRWPFVFRRTMEARLQTSAYERDELRKSKDKEIQETEKSVARIADRCSMIRWFRDGDHYRLMLSVDPRAFGTGYHQDQQLMAMLIGRKVEAELASSKFIQKAADEEVRHLNFKPGFGHI